MHYKYKILSILSISHCLLLQVIAFDKEWYLQVLGERVFAYSGLLCWCVSGGFFRHIRKSIVSCNLHAAHGNLEFSAN